MVEDDEKWLFLFKLALVWLNIIREWFDKADNYSSLIVE